MGSSYGVDPHTSVIIVATVLPGMFVAFVLLGTAIYLRKRARYAKHEKLRVKEQGEHVPGDYEKWLEHVLTPGASTVPSQNASLQRLPALGEVRRETTGDGEVNSGAMAKGRMATVREVSVDEVR